MAIVIAQTASTYMADKIKTLIENIRAAGEGPGKMPPIDARELAGLLGIYLNTSTTFQFGKFTVGAAAGGDDHVVKLAFAPKAVIAYLTIGNGGLGTLLLKLAPMGAGTPAAQDCLSLEQAVPPVMTFGNYMSFRDETVPVAPATYDLNAFTILAGALVNNDVISWLAIG